MKKIGVGVAIGIRIEFFKENRRMWIEETATKDDPDSDSDPDPDENVIVNEGVSGGRKRNFGYRRMGPYSSEI
jgi:hypothetical protein